MKMKFLMLLLFGFGSLAASAQQIQENEKQFAVSNPDSVFTGKIIIDKENRTKIFLTGFQQTVDSAGFFITTYTFGSKNYRPAFDINIRMKFGNPLIPDGPIGFQYGSVGVGRYSGSGALQNNNSFLYLRGQMTAQGRHFYIKVKSSQKINATIAGVDGQANF